jgi:hypothetical protein
MLGKSGKHYNNPHVARAHGDMAEEMHEREHEGRQGEHGGGGGDGKHHHHIVAHGDGTYTSHHTHPDGHVEHAEHPHFQHAMQHAAAKFEEAPHNPEAENEPGEAQPEGRSNFSGAGDLESMYE